MRRGWRTTRLRRRLKTPSPALRLVVSRLRAYLETAPGAALVLVEVECVDGALVAISALADRLAAEGQRVILTDVATNRPLGALLGAKNAGGTIQMVSLNGHDVGMFVAPDDPIEMADKEVGEEADFLLILATLDPAFGAEHIAAWASDAVVMVRSGGASLARIEGVANQLRSAGMIIRSGLLVDMDPDDHSSGVPADLAPAPDPTAFLIESLKGKSS